MLGCSWHYRNAKDQALHFLYILFSFFSCPCPHVHPHWQTLQEIFVELSLNIRQRAQWGFPPITLTANLGRGFFLIWIPECIWGIFFLPPTLLSPPWWEQIKLRSKGGEGNAIHTLQASLSARFLIMAIWSCITIVHLFSNYSLPSTLQSALCVLWGIMESS